MPPSGPPLRLRVHSHLLDLPDLHRSVEGWLDERDASDDLRYDVELVLEELLTNLAKYAWDDDAVHAIDVALDVRDGAVEIEVRDDGRPFDPNAAPPPAFPDRLEDRRPGGLGLHLVRQVADRLDYRSEGERNVLSVRLKSPTGA